MTDQQFSKAQLSKNRWCPGCAPVFLIPDIAYAKDREAAEVCGFRMCGS
ncbi:hypothetical protein [Sphingosinicella soli]|nr:hypothetical protein [Sphingosinicella soli]